MRTFIVEVPDTCVIVGGGTNGHLREERAVTADLVREALILDDYHMNVYFDDPVRVRPAPQPAAASATESAPAVEAPAEVAVAVAVRR